MSRQLPGNITVFYSEETKEIVRINPEELYKPKQKVKVSSAFVSFDMNKRYSEYQCTEYKAEQSVPFPKVEFLKIKQRQTNIPSLCLHVQVYPFDDVRMDNVLWEQVFYIHETSDSNVELPAGKQVHQNIAQGQKDSFEASIQQGKKELREKRGEILKDLDQKGEEILAQISDEKKQLASEFVKTLAQLVEQLPQHNEEFRIQLDNLKNMLEGLSDTPDKINTLESKIEHRLVEQQNQLKNDFEGKLEENKADTFKTLKTEFAKIDGLQSQMETLTNTVADVSAKVEAVTSRIGNVEKFVETINSTIAELPGTINEELSKTIPGTVAEGYQNVDKKFDELTRKLDDLPNTISGQVSQAVAEGFKGVEEKLESFTERLDSLPDEISEAASQATDKIVSDFQPVIQKFDDFAEKLNNLPGEIRREISQAVDEAVPTSPASLKRRFEDELRRHCNDLLRESGNGDKIADARKKSEAEIEGAKSKLGKIINCVKELKALNGQLADDARLTKVHAGLNEEVNRIQQLGPNTALTFENIFPQRDSLFPDYEIFFREIRDKLDQEPVTLEGYSKWLGGRYKTLMQDCPQRIKDSQERFLAEIENYPAKITNGILERVLTLVEVIENTIQSTEQDADEVQKLEEIMSQIISTAGLEEIKVQPGKDKFEPLLHESAGSEKCELKRDTIIKVQRRGFYYKNNHKEKRIIQKPRVIIAV